MPNVDWAPGGSKSHHVWKGFLSDVLVGWVGKWLNLPEMGFWHGDMPQSISNTDGGKILMKYKLKDEDKQPSGRTPKNGKAA
jgi:hypothetical protein